MEYMMNRMVKHNMKPMMIVFAGLGIVSIPYWCGYVVGHIEARSIHAVLEVLEHKND